MSLSRFLLPLLALQALAARLELSSPQLSLVASSGELIAKHSLSPGNPLPLPVRLESTQTLRLSFQIIDDSSRDGVQPHQVFLRLHDPVTDEEGILPIRVSSSGNVKYELSMARPPLTLPPSGANPLSANLILGSFAHSPSQWHLFDLQLPQSHTIPQHPDEILFHPLPNISHAFRPEPKHPSVITSGAFTLLVVSPWLILLTLVANIPNRLSNLLSARVFPFVCLLGALEALLVKYWMHLKLGDILLYGSGLGLVTIGFGKRALTALSEIRRGQVSRAV